MNIFIAGLSYNLSEAELEELFAEYGEVVSAKVIPGKGRCSGYRAEGHEVAGGRKESRGWH